MLPVNLRTVSPALLKTAGAGTPTVASLGRELVDLERIGPASQLLAAAKTVNDPRAPAPEHAIETFAVRQPALIAWGGWDAALDPLFNLRSGPAGARARRSLRFSSRRLRRKIGAYLILRALNRWVGCHRAGAGILSLGRRSARCRDTG
jgi:hypothetical protein